MKHLKADLESLESGERAMQAAAEDFAASVDKVMAAAGDPSALGNRDMVGGVASMIYQSLLDYVQSCSDSLGESFSGHQEGLRGTAAAYRDTEATNIEQTKGII